MKVNKKGFTIIELLIAMAAFTAMALIASLTILQIGKMYYKGVTSIEVQNITRSTTSAIVEQLQFSKGVVQTGGAVFGSYTPPETFQSVCVGENRYTFVINRIQDKDGIHPTGHTPTEQTITHALWYDKRNDLSVCPPADLGSTVLESTPAPSSVPGSGRDLLNENMRLTQFAVTEDVVTHLVDIRIGVIYGDYDLIDWAGDPVCKGSIVGSQWCAKSLLGTKAYKFLP